jgi:pimeloyl-ACP methyl ester carboxylesterase
MLCIVGHCSGYDCLAKTLCAICRLLQSSQVSIYDWGALVTEQMGVLAPPELLGVHTNLPSAIPAEIFQAIQAGSPPPGLVADENRAFERLAFFLTPSRWRTTRRRCTGLRTRRSDSPIGLAAWFLDHDLLSYELIARAFDGQREGLSRDDVLDNITITWVTNTGISGARLYRENKLPLFAPMGVTVPIAVSAFPDELYQLPRSWAERAYPKLIHYNKLEKGGHFAAWEQPKLLVDELRVGFKSLR